jgi:hypothetical protein
VTGYRIFRRDELEFATPQRDGEARAPLRGQVLHCHMRVGSQDLTPLVIPLALQGQAEHLPD